MPDATQNQETTQQPPPDNQETQQQPPQESGAEFRKKFEDEQAARKAAQDENAKLKRDLALTHAGLDNLDDAKLTALFAVHGDKELSKDTLLETANALGFSGATQASTPPPANPDLSAETRMQGAMQAPPPNPTGSGTEEEFRAELDRVEREGGQQAVLSLIRQKGGQFGLVVPD